MPSIKELQDAAAKERNIAETTRAEAEKHRQTANKLKIDTDPNVVLSETEQAQVLEERAQLHDTTATELIQKSSILEKEAVEAEREKQTTQVEAQRKIDRLDDKIKKLRGE